jgi:hypothetical protein
MAGEPGSVRITIARVQALTNGKLTSRASGRIDAVLVEKPAGPQSQRTPHDRTEL